MGSDCIHKAFACIEEFIDLENACDVQVLKGVINIIICGFYAVKVVCVIKSGELDELIAI